MVKNFKTTVQTKEANLVLLLEYRMREMHNDSNVLKSISNYIQGGINCIYRTCKSYKCM